MTVRPVIVVGNLTIDDVVQPDGSSQMGTLGGNSVHAAAAALTWTDEVGVVALGLAAARQIAEQAIGVPVRIGGQLADAVAASGATSVQDHEIAVRAAAAVSGGGVA